MGQSNTRYSSSTRAAGKPSDLLLASTGAKVLRWRYWTTAYHYYTNPSKAELEKLLKHVGSRVLVRELNGMRRMLPTELSLHTVDYTPHIHARLANATLAKVSHARTKPMHKHL